MTDSLGTALPREMARVRDEVMPAYLATRDRIAHMLTMLPDEGTDEFDDLSEFEQEFLPSCRSQFERKGTLSERQVEILERLYAKH
jgi:hypothetical protein